MKAEEINKIVSCTECKKFSGICRVCYGDGEYSIVQNDQVIIDAHCVENNKMDIVEFEKTPVHIFNAKYSSDTIEFEGENEILQERYASTDDLTVDECISLSEELGEKTMADFFREHCK